MRLHTAGHVIRANPASVPGARDAVDSGGRRRRRGCPDQRSLEPSRRCAI